MEIAGVIEGFYGRPWSWDERIDVGRWCAARGLRDYVYAPKDDPKHRSEWRSPYDRDELAGFARVVAESGLRLGFAISPGLSIDPTDRADRRALAEKVDQVLDAGARLVVLALDDIPFGGGPQGRDHAALTTWLREHLADRAALALVPTEYVGTSSTPYLDALAEGAPHDVPIGWTGVSVVPPVVTAAEARARADALGGRRPLLWDNAAANDAVMADRVPMGPLRGREPGLRDHLAGYVANPCTQPRAAQLHLASVAAWLRGDDPESGWTQAATERAARTLAEACDGEVPLDLVGAALHAWPDEDAWPREAASLRSWLAAAATCSAGDLGEDLAAWVDQTRTEADLARSALDLLETCRSAPETIPPEAVVGLALGWRKVRRARPTVMGTRLGVSPAFGQAPDGTWTVLPGTVVEGRSATDALVRAALRASGALAGPVG